MVSRPTDPGAKGETNGRTLFVLLLKKSPYIVVITSIITFYAYLGLAEFAPKYRATAKLLIDTSESFAAGIGSTNRSEASRLDEEIVASQVQLMRSRDLARSVTKKFNLESRPEFSSSATGISLISDVFAGIGLRRDSSKSSQAERTLERFSMNLSVNAVDGSRVIAIEFSSLDSELAARVPNALATEYIALQQAAKRTSSESGAQWLESEINTLRMRIDEMELKLEAYRLRADALPVDSGSLSAPLQHKISAGSAEVSRTLQANAGRVTSADIQSLESDALKQRELLDSYLQRYREALVRSRSDFLPIDVRVLSRAAVPIEPYFPKTGPITLAVGLIALSILSMFFLLRETGRRRAAPRGAPIPLPEVASQFPKGWRSPRIDDLGSSGDTEEAPALAPDLDDGLPLSCQSAAEIVVAESYKRIVVVAPEGGEGGGRSDTAVVLARAIAGLNRRPVLIDFRNGSGSDVQVEESASLPGFSDLCDGSVSFGQVIFRDHASRVHFIPTGSHKPSPQGIAGDRFRPIISALDHTYDHVIFDVSDEFFEMLGPECDAEIVAIECNGADVSTHRAVEKIREISNAKILLLTTDRPAPYANTSNFVPSAEQHRD